MALAVKKKKKSPFKRFRPGQHDIEKPYIVPPKLLRKEPKLTIKQLLNTMNPQRKEAVKEIAVKAIRTMALPKSSIIPQDTLTYRVQTYSKHNKHIHNCTIFVMDHKFQAFSPESKVIVDCSCSSHKYQCEYNLAKRGNALLWRSNGEPPMVNTTLLCCKHTYIALRVLLRRSKYGKLPKKSQVQKKMLFSRST